MTRTPLSLCVCLWLSLGLVTLFPPAGFGQLPGLETAPEAAAEPEFPDPLRLADGWQQALRDGDTLSPEKLTRWRESLVKKTREATAEKPVEPDLAPLIANLEELAKPKDAPAPTEAAPAEVKTLRALLELVEIRRKILREQGAANTQLRLEKELAADVQIRLNQARQNYISSDINAPERATLGWRWLRMWSRQALVEKKLAAIDAKQKQLATSLGQFETLLASPPGNLTFDEASLDYWKKQVEDLAPAEEENFADYPGTDLSQELTPKEREAALRKLTEAASGRANHLAYRVAERALQFTEVQLELRESRPAPADEIDEINGWKRDIDTVMSNQRDRLLATIEASSLDVTESGTSVQKDIALLRALSEQLNRIDTEREKYQLIERQFAIVDGFSISNFSVKWSLFSDRFEAFSENVLNRTLFNVNESPVTGGGILRMLIIIAIAYLFSWILRRIFERLERRKNISAAAAYTFNRVLHYALILIGFLIAISSIGVDLTKFALFASAIGVGLGFGLQAIISNFVSGLIILFERSLKIGDFVELESGVTGRVNEINVRGTLITTNDNIDILVPNSEFVNGKVTNWTLRDVVRRLRIRFGVAYGSDKELVKKAGLEAAASLPFTLRDNPKRVTQVWLVGFGDSSLDFELVVWISGDAVSSPNAVDAAYKWAIETALKKYQIEIPFPQQDLHVRSYFGLTGNAAINAVAGQEIQREAPKVAAVQLSSSERRELEANDAVADTLRSMEEFKLDKEREKEREQEATGEKPAEEREPSS